MKFKIEVSDGTGTWWETFDNEEVTDEATAKEWATKTIKWFNKTRRHGEVERKFVGGVEIVSAGTKKHDWSKQNLYTLSDHRGHFDNVRCTRCGATARRYGIYRIVRQTPYREKNGILAPE